MATILFFQQLCQTLIDFNNFAPPFVKTASPMLSDRYVSVCLETLVCCGQTVLLDQDATWYGGRPRHRRHCVRWGPSSPDGKG